MSGIYERIPASPEDVETYAGEIPEQYLYCRVWHHDPVPHDIRLVTAKDRDPKHPTATWVAHLRCSHLCGVKWKVLVDSDGAVLSRRVDYSESDGYVLKGKGRIDKHGNQILRQTYFGQKKPAKKRRTQKKAAA